MRRALGACALLLALSGCSSLPWSTDEPPLPGERHPVMLLNDRLVVDPAAAALVIELPPPVENESWPQPGGVPTHALYHLAAAPQLERAWATDIGSGGERLLGAPIVARGLVFAVDGDGEISALATSDGRVVWSTSPDSIERADRLRGGGLAFADDRIFAVYFHGDVIALDAATGSEIWRQRLGAPMRTSPTAVEGKLLVPTADNRLFALDAETGRILWQQSALFEQAAILGGSPPAVVGNIVIAAYSSGEVFALLLDTGNPVWTDTVVRPRRTLAIDAITDIVSPPVIDRDRVILTGNGGETIALNLERGGRIWQQDITSLVMPWVAGPVVFFVTERGELVSMLRDTGQVRSVTSLHSADEDTDRAASHTGPLLMNERLFLASSNGELLSVSPYTGEVLERSRLPAGVSVPLAAADGTLYILSNDGTVSAYR